VTTCRGTDFLAHWPPFENRKKIPSSEKGAKGRDHKTNGKKRTDGPFSPGGNSTHGKGTCMGATNNIRVKVRIEGICGEEDSLMEKKSTPYD